MPAKTKATASKSPAMHPLKRVGKPDGMAGRPGSSKRKIGDERSAGSSQMDKKIKQEEDMVCPLCQMPWYICDSKGKSRDTHKNAVTSCPASKVREGS